MDDHPPLEAGEDATLFTQPRAEVFVTVLWVCAVVFFVCRGLSLLVQVLLGHPPTLSELVVVAETMLVVPPVVASVLMLLLWHRLGWLKSTVQGLEFAATGRRGVHLGWASVASVGLRRWGPFAELVVTPTDMAAVTELPGPGRRPRVLRRESGSAFVIDVGMMSPGPRTLLAELHRRIPSRV